MKIEQIHPNYICQLWDQVRDPLSNALAHAAGEYSVSQLRYMLVRGEQILLVAYDDERVIHGAASISFHNYPNDRIAYITAAGGRFISTPEVFDQLAEWCRLNGCTKIRGSSRESVARLWQQKLSFEQKYIIVERAL